MQKPERSLKVFVSSPGDVEEERLIAQRVLKRLADQFSRILEIETIFWEHEPQLATQSFQEQIPSPAETDIVVCILWARIGTRLPSKIHRPDGSTFASGTEFEFETAAEAFRRAGRPDLVVYRKTAQPASTARTPEEALSFAEQWRALDDFVKKWFHGADGTLVAAFNPFHEPADFEQLLELHLRKLIERRLAAWGLPSDVASLPPPASWTAGSPFRGLAVFEFEHAPIYFGRTRAVSDVLSALRRQAQDGHAFLVIVGSSGCGKSSLVRAGVLPMLTEPGVIEGVGLWRRATLRPSAVFGTGAPAAAAPQGGDLSADLFTGLAAALTEPPALPELLADGTSVTRLAEMLRKAPGGAYGVVKGALSEAAALVKPAQEARTRPEARLVLLVDQLEEIFSDPRIAPADRAALFEAILDLAQSGKVWVIATLRNDFYPQFQELAQRSTQEKRWGQWDVAPPTHTEIGRMIREPAAAAGLRFDVDAETGQTLDEALENEAATLEEGLPLLEFALDELYQRAVARGTPAPSALPPAGPAARPLLSFADYRDLGQLIGCLARRAEQTFQELDPPAQAVFDRVFRKLVILDGKAGSATHRIAPKVEFDDDPAQARFVERFVAARLFTADRSQGPDNAATVRIAHETLLKRAAWQRLHDWLGRDLENLQKYGRLAAAANRWQESGRRADLLLRRGKQLDEAKDLRAAQFELSVVESELVAASLRQAGRARLVRRVAVAALVVLTVLAVLGGGVAEYQRRRAEDSLRDAERSLYARQIADIKNQLDNGEDAEAFHRLLLTRVELRGWEYAYLSSLLGQRLHLIAAGGVGIPDAVAVFPDNRTVVFADMRAVTLVDNDSGETIRSFPLEAGKRETLVQLHGLAISPDGKQLAVAISGWQFGRTLVYDPATGKRTLTLDTGGTADAVTFSPDGQRIVTAGGNIVRAWGSARGQKALDFPVPASWRGAAVCFSPDGKRLAGAGTGGLISEKADERVIVWDAATGETQLTFPGRDCVAFSHDGTRIATADPQTGVVICAAQSGRKLRALGVPAQSVAFSPHAEQLATASRFGMITVWDSASGAELGHLGAHGFSPTSTVVFSPDGTWVVSTCFVTNNDTALLYWSPARPDDARVLNNGNAAVNAVAFAKDGQEIAGGSADGSIKLWDVTSGREARSIPAHARGVSALAISRDQTRLATGSADGAVTLWDAASLQPIDTLRIGEGLHFERIAGLAVSPDGRRIAVSGTLNRDRPAEKGSPTAGRAGGEETRAANAAGAKTAAADPTVPNPYGEPFDFMIDLDPGRGFPTGALVVFDRRTRSYAMLARDITGYGGVAFSPDGTRIGVAGAFSVQIRDPSKSDVVQEFKADSGTTPNRTADYRFAYSVDGKRIAVPGERGTVKIYDTSKGTKLVTLRGHEGRVKDVAFHPDGTRLASAGTDRTVRLWDASTGRELLILRGHGKEVTGVAFSPNGTRLASASADGTVRLWNGSGWPGLQKAAIERSEDGVLHFPRASKSR